MPNPAPLPGSFICHRCGQRFDNQFIRRRHTRVVNSLDSAGARIFTAKVSLCPACSRRVTINNIITAIVAVIAIIVVFSLVFGPR